MKRLKSFGKILLGLVRELSDESAYRRHLSVHGRQHSPEEWRKFSEHHLRAKYSRVKCCAVALAAGLSLGAAVAEAQTIPLARRSASGGGGGESPLRLSVQRFQVGVLKVAEHGAAGGMRVNLRERGPQ
jgi:hypothetical protein